MADLVVTAAQVAAIFPLKAEIHNVIAAVAVTAGQALYQDSSGDYDLADASVAGTAGARGIALQGAGAAQGVNILKKGHVAGFTISQAYDAPLYVSNTAGAIADAAGVVSVLCGTVVALSDKDRTKVLYLEFDWAS
jgi:hypothetical protein